MVDEAEAELLGDPLLQRFEFFVDELDDAAGFDIDQMVVMSVRRGFVARTAVAELVAFEDARFLEQANGPVDGRDRDLRVDGGGALMQRLDVGMIFGFRQDLRDRRAAAR